MSKEVEFGVIIDEVLAVLQRHGLSPQSIGLTMGISAKEFDALQPKGQRRNNTMILVSSNSDFQWSVKIIREWEIPRNMIVSPPE